MYTHKNYIQLLLAVLLHSIPQLTNRSGFDLTREHVDHDVLRGTIHVPIKKMKVGQINSNESVTYLFIMCRRTSRRTLLEKVPA